MAYLLRNICTKHYWNRTTIVEIVVGGWVVSFFETQCSVPAQETAKHRAKFGWPPVSDVAAVTNARRETR